MGLTAIALYAPGDTITSAWANILRTNFGVLDARTGDDPGTANYWLVSDGATSAAWVARNTAVLAALGYTPINKAGDSGIGTLTLSGTLNASGVASDSNGVNVSGSGPITTAGTITGGGFTGGSTSTGTVQASGVAVGSNGINVVSNGPITTGGQISGGSYTGGSAAAGVPAVLGLTVGTQGIATAGTIQIAGQEVYWSGNPPPASSGGQLVGEIREYAAASLTTANAAGWLLCDGSTVSRTTHAALFLAIGVAYGSGDGSTTFTLPDFRDRAPFGASGTKTVGSSGGSATINIEHAHSGSSLSITGNTGAPSATDGLGNGGGTSTPTTTHTHGAGTLDVAGDTANAGSSSQSVQNPYTTVRFIIYSGVAT
jgi:microcystin-dependent protein